MGWIMPIGACLSQCLCCKYDSSRVVYSETEINHYVCDTVFIAT